MQTNIQILYIDDEIINLELFKFNFSKKYNVFIAQSGPEGMKILENNREINIVISDMKMPFMSGLEFIRLASIKFNGIRYFILTGHDVTEDIQEALDKKMILKYFRKPFNLNELETAISNLIQSDSAS